MLNAKLTSNDAAQAHTHGDLRHTDTRTGHYKGSERCGNTYFRTLL